MKTIRKNQRFGEWKANRIAGKDKHGKILWSVTCSCGTTRNIVASKLTTGHSKSCGCFRATSNKLRTRHGHARKGELTRTYNSWRAMKERCENPSNISYPYYGGRGIRFGSRWKFFFKFLIDMGPRPLGKTLDRINPNGNYTKQNCRWTTPKEQTANRRSRA